MRWGWQHEPDDICAVVVLDAGWPVIALIKQNDELLRFHCPGCNRAHAIQHGSDFGPNWSWNGSLERPTFSPSVLVTYPGADAGRDGAPPAVCHSFVTDGRIQFLSDCTHAQAGQTVDLPPWGEP